MEEQKSESLALLVDRTVAALQKYQEEKGSSQIALGRAIGVSGPVISQLLQKNYKGDVQKVCRQVLDYLELEEQRDQLFTSPYFVKTKQATDVLLVCSMAHKYRFLGLVLARAGLGKTTALREYRANHSNVVMITGSTWNCSRGAIATLLGREVRISSTYSTLTDIIELIIHKLGSGALVIIDEAQHLPRETLDGIRYINDMAGVGVVLSGTLQVATRLVDKRVGINYEQIASRVGIRRTLSEKIIREDVRRIISQAITNPEDEIIDYCWQKANSPGGYRTMMRYAQVALAMSEARKEIPHLKHFQAAEKELMV
jgi:DNA transposition AAA+ family ATPase